MGYIGFDASTYLVRHAQTKRGMQDVHVLDLEQLQGEAGETLRARIAGADPCTIVSIVLVLEHLEQPDEFLAWLGMNLGGLAHDVPVLIVTLDGARFRPVPGVDRFSSTGEHYDVLIESMPTPPNVVSVRLRSNLEYEQIFRDAGFFVRSCEPLHFFSRPTEDLSRLPTFWAWRLSARRRRIDRPQRARLMKHVTARVPNDMVARMVMYRVESNERILCARNLGGGLVVILEGDAVVTYRVAPPQPAPSYRSAEKRERASPASRLHPGRAELVFRPGSLLGELEADGPEGPTHYSHDVFAGAEGCTVGVIATADVRRLLQEETGIQQLVFEKIRRRLQLLIYRDGVSDVGEGWRSSLRDKQVPPHVEGGAPKDLWRAARALIWGAAIERRGRVRGGFEDIAFLDLKQVSLLVQPNTNPEYDKHLKYAFRLFHFLRIIDAFPMKLLRDDRSVGDDTRQLGDSLLQEVCETLLFPLVGVGNKSRLVALCRNLRDDESAFQIRWAPTKGFQEKLDALEGLLQRGEAADRAIADFEFYVIRLSNYFHDLGSSLFFILRDTTALRQIALGDAMDIKRAVVPRARHLIDDTIPALPSWENLLEHSSRERKLHYLRTVGHFFKRDLQFSRKLLYSDEMLSWRASS